MASINKVQLLGRLGKDPVFREHAEYGEMAYFSLATSEEVEGAEGAEDRVVVEWHRVVIFNPKFLQMAKQSLRKGVEVYLEGQNRTRRFQKKGDWIPITEVVLFPDKGDMQITDRGPPPSRPQQSQAPAPDKSGQPPPLQPGQDEDELEPF